MTRSAQPRRGRSASAGEDSTRPVAAGAAKTRRAAKRTAALESREKTSLSQEACVGAPAVAAKAKGLVEVRLTLIRGGLTNVWTPVAIGGRYDGLPFGGPTGAFDRLLDSWLTRGV